MKTFVAIFTGEQAYYLGYIWEILLFKGKKFKRYNNDYGEVEQVIIRITTDDYYERGPQVIMPSILKQLSIPKAKKYIIKTLFTEKLEPGLKVLKR